MTEQERQETWLRRADLPPMERAVSDSLDELLVRHHGIFTSWSNPESFLTWLRERGYDVTPLATPDPGGVAARKQEAGS